MDSIFGPANDDVRIPNDNGTKEESTTSSMFAKSSVLPKTKASSKLPPTTTSTGQPPPPQPLKKRNRNQLSRQNILHQRQRQSQHPLIASSLDFPGVFEQEEHDHHARVEELPWEEQVIEMAQAVQEHGLCVIRNAVDTTILQELALEVQQLQSKVCRALDQRGIPWKVMKNDPVAVDPQTIMFRFQEAASRCRGRMDVAITKQDETTPSKRNNTAGPATNLLRNFYKDTTIQQTILQNPKVYPIIRHLLGAAVSNDDDSNNDDDDALKLVYAGLIFNLPHSDDQPWHQDGAPLFPEARNSTDMQASFPPYALNVFLPLETHDGAVERGPTEFLPGSHRWNAAQLEQVNNNTDSSSSHGLEKSSDNDVASPILKQGDVLIYDYRVCHRGTSNLERMVEGGGDTKDGGDEATKVATRRILYLMYARPWFTDHINFDYTKSAASIWSK